MQIGYRQQLDILVRKATVGYGAQFVAVSTAITALYTFVVDIVAQSTGSGAVARADRAHMFQFKVPANGNETMTEAINMSQVGVGTLSSMIFVASVIGFAVTTCMLTFECRRSGSFTSCLGSSSTWGRHSLMTLLLWLLMVAIASESYFFYVPLRPGGGIFGQGPIMVAMGSMQTYLAIAGRMIGAAAQGDNWTIHDILPTTLARVAALGQPWASSVVVALAAVASIIIGSTTAPRPHVEFRLKTARATWIVAGAVCSGLAFTLAAGCMGLSLIGVNRSVLAHGIEGLQELGNTLGAVGANATVTGFGPVVNATGLLQASVAGEDGVPLLFPTLLQFATNEGRAGELEALRMRGGQEGVLRAAQAWSQLDASVSESEAIKLLAPQVNDVTTSQLNSGCFVQSAKVESLAVHAALASFRGATEAVSQHAALPLRLSPQFLSTDPSTDGPTTTIPLLPDYTGSAAVFVFFTLVSFVSTLIFAASLLLTPSRGLDEATRAAAHELRSIAGRDGQGVEGGEHDGEECCSYRCMHEAMIDTEVACARCIAPSCGCCSRVCCWCECCRCCCSMGLPRCCHPALKPVFVPARRNRTRHRNKAVTSGGNGSHGGSDGDRQEDMVRVNTRRWGVVGATELRVAACMHETLVTARHSLDLCGTDQDEGQVVGHSAADKAAAARRPSSLLVRSSMARARLLGASLKVITVLIMAGLFLEPFVLSRLRQRSIRMCQCATARTAGLGPDLGACAADVADRPLDDLLGPVASEYLHDSTAARIVIRLVQGALRLLLVASIYVYARQSEEMERAVEVSERQKVALQSRVRFLSHECRVPLNSVVLGLDFCQEGASATKGALGKLHAARVQADRLRRALLQDTADEASGQSQIQSLRNVRRRHQLAVDQLTSSVGETTEALEEAVCLFDDTLPSLEAATEAMQTTLNDVLDLQHIESGRLQITMRLAPILPSMLAETKQAFLAQAEGMGVSLDTCNRHSASGKSFECDPPRIRGAVYNFVSNALKWSRPDEVLVKRLQDKSQRVGKSLAGRRQVRPRVIVGSAECPPHLWGARQWREAWAKIGPEACSRLHRIVTGHALRRSQPGQSGDRLDVRVDVGTRTGLREYSTDSSGKAQANTQPQGRISARPNHTAGPISAGPISSGALSMSHGGSFSSIGSVLPEDSNAPEFTLGSGPSGRGVKHRDSGAQGGKGSRSGPRERSNSIKTIRSGDTGETEHEWMDARTSDSPSGNGDSWAVSGVEDPDKLAAAEAAAAVRRGACGPLSQMLEEEEDEGSLVRRQPAGIGTWGHSRDAATSTQRDDRDQLPTEAQIAPDTVEVYDELLRGLKGVSAGDDARVPVHGKEGSATSGIAWEESAWGASGNRGENRGVEGRSGEISGRSSFGDNDASSASGRISSDQIMPVCMWVYDEGPGIHKRDWRQVFTPFETLHSGILTAEGQGSGLGLAITATVMKMHGGCVGFSSMPGVGSVFFLWTKMRVAGGSTGISSRSRSRSHSLPASVSDVNDILGGTEAATIQLTPRVMAAQLSHNDSDGDRDALDGKGAMHQSKSIAGTQQEGCSDSAPPTLGLERGEAAKGPSPSVASAGAPKGPSGDACILVGQIRAGVPNSNAASGAMGVGETVEEDDGAVSPSHWGASYGVQYQPVGTAGQADTRDARVYEHTKGQDGGKRKKRRVVKKKKKKPTASQDLELPAGVISSQQAQGRQGVASDPSVPAASAATTAPVAQIPPAPPASPGKVVLVVDDSRTNRLFLSRMVRSADRSILVLQASDGQEGLDVLKQRAQQMGDQAHGLAADLVLLDFSMPRMSGPEMARAVREDNDRRISGVPIVGVTGNALPEDQALFRECGAQDVLLKPVRRAQVGTLLGRMEELRSALA